ncbi:MAG: DNA mismatch repair protein MutS, partial [Deltaproteobacteria bacterium]|nr:DNA mismatch repair protein MutS [Deltaproteobacteria bacterium]
MMQQYLDAKAACPDALVMMRMGDFYELFLEDAVEAAELLELTLTARNKKDDNPIPMAGVPYHALQTYLPRLLAAGRKVAIVEQVEDPKLAKGLVRREIARVVSPGVVLDEAVLDTREPNWLAAIAPPDDAPDEGARWGLAWLDVSTGLRHATARASLAEILTELARLEPKEVVVPRQPATLHGDVRRAFPKVALALRDLPASSLETAASPLEAATSAAADLVLDYAKDLHRGGELALRPLVVLGPDERMALPATTVRNLELLRSMMDGGKKGSLLGLLDQTRTAMGSRLLRSWLLAPLLDRAAIQRRHDAVQAALEAPLLRAELRDLLRGVSDLERLVGRVAARVATPRDLAALAASLERVPRLAERLASADVAALEADPTARPASGRGPLAALAQDLDPVHALAVEIRRLLVDEPPPTLKEGGVIREGADPDLDQLIAIAREGKDWFEAYEARLRDASKIPSVKIRFNSVFGYYIEVTRANLHLVPDTWLRKQTLANAERYYTVELKEREDKVLGADDKRLALEERLFTGLRDHAASFGARVQETAQRLAELDVLLAFAELAATRGWVRPTLVDEPLVDIRGGRHPVVEAMLPPGSFVPNDLVLAPDRRLVILTGPNMAGKSTVMRQTAIIAILAQIGAFVPAEAATLGLVDKVFTRVGASDDLARGQSTFMVEMTETTEILRESTDRSLVVLDEIGRGTSTWDGLSIAWAVAEHLHDQSRCLALFATHYHELTELASTRDAVRNLSIAVREQANDVVFLRRLIEGGASKSYGIQVARLAGLPDALLARAREVLENLEAMSVDPDSRPRLARGGKRPATWQLSLFAPKSESDSSPSEPPPVAPATPDRLAQDLRQLLAVDPDELTPKAALDLVYKLRAAVQRHDGRPAPS